LIRCHLGCEPQDTAFFDLVLLVVRQRGGEVEPVILVLKKPGFMPDAKRQSGSKWLRIEGQIATRNSIIMMLVSAQRGFNAYNDCTG
jgi:hypothetical protein